MSLEISELEVKEIILSRQQITKVHISLHGSAVDLCLRFYAYAKRKIFSLLSSVVGTVFWLLGSPSRLLKSSYSNAVIIKYFQTDLKQAFEIGTSYKCIKITLLKTLGDNGHRFFHNQNFHMTI